MCLCYGGLLLFSVNCSTKENLTLLKLRHYLDLVNDFFKENQVICLVLITSLLSQKLTQSPSDLIILYQFQCLLTIKCKQVRELTWMGQVISPIYVIAAISACFTNQHSSVS